MLTDSEEIIVSKDADNVRLSSTTLMALMTACDELLQRFIHSAFVLRKKYLNVLALSLISLTLTCVSAYFIYRETTSYINYKQTQQEEIKNHCDIAPYNNTLDCLRLFNQTQVLQKTVDSFPLYIFLALLYTIAASVRTIQTAIKPASARTLTTAEYDALKQLYQQLLLIFDLVESKHPLATNLNTLQAIVLIRKIKALALQQLNSIKGKAAVDTCIEMAPDERLSAFGLFAKGNESLLVGHTKNANSNSKDHVPIEEYDEETPLLAPHLTH